MDNKTTIYNNIALNIGGKTVRINKLMTRSNGHYVVESTTPLSDSVRAIIGYYLESEGFVSIKEESINE
jgi:hypothetical protein